MFNIVFAGLMGLFPMSDESFVENFDSLNQDMWIIADWRAPGNTGNHAGDFYPGNIDIIDGYLRIRVDQERNAAGMFISSGGEIYTHQQFGYGTYEFRMRASTTSPTPYGEGEAVSGAVSASFVYAPGAVTEIDIEFESGERSDKTHLLSWQGENRDNQHSELSLDGPAPHEQFYTYQFVWEPGVVSFFRDGVLIGQHHQVVPSELGHMVFNHWGTHSQWWGGWSTQDVPRYMYVDYFQFTPL